MDISKVSPAPWKTFLDKYVRSGEGFTIIKIDDCGSKSDAEFIALARNAFDVMMRTSWNPFVDYSKDGDLLWFCMCDARIPKEVTGPYDNPFTALIECDKWYKENVDKK